MVALLADARGKLVRRIERGPSNLRLLSDAELLKRFAELAHALPRPSAIGIALAGAREERDWNRVAMLAR